MKNKSLLPFLLSALFVLSGMVSLNMFSTGTVYASTPSVPAHHITKVIVHMHFVHSSKNKTIPDNTITDDCGTIEFYIDNDGGGTAEFVEYASSSQGIIESLSYSVSWYNYQTRKGLSV